MLNARMYSLSLPWMDRRDMTPSRDWTLQQDDNDDDWLLSLGVRDCVFLVCKLSRSILANTSMEPMVLQNMWMKERKYGYLKSTFAKADLFSRVTPMLLMVQNSSHALHLSC